MKRYVVSCGLAMTLAAMVVSSCSGDDKSSSADADSRSAVRSAVEAFAAPQVGMPETTDQDCLRERFAEFDDETLETAAQVIADSDFDNMPASVEPVFSAAIGCTTTISDEAIENMVDGYMEATVAADPDRECVTDVISQVDAQDLETMANEMFADSEDSLLGKELEKCLHAGARSTGG